jgi:hypothetical protein
MVAQTATRRITKTKIQQFANLQKELAGSANVNIDSNTTTTITFVHTAATGAITVDYAST